VIPLVSKALSIFLALAAWLGQAHAAEVTVAVAANFAAPMKVIAQAFDQQTGHKAILSFGATGAFYAQIKNGAPFDVFLAADSVTPARIEREGLGVAGSRFTYSIGKLVLWSKQPGFVDDKGAVLRNSKFQRIAIANPKLAPYGAAAIEAMTKLGVLAELRPKIVQGDNIAQTYQFVATENAQLGFIALAQVMSEGKLSQGSVWIVPQTMHAPIRQDAVLLTRGKANPAAAALIAFLKGENARAVIRSYGYEL
jgi:molybdate transport system substrate-binding protein